MSRSRYPMTADFSRDKPSALPEESRTCCVPTSCVDRWPFQRASGQHPVACADRPRADSCIFLVSIMRGLGGTSELRSRNRRKDCIGNTFRVAFRAYGDNSRFAATVGDCPRCAAVPYSAGRLRNGHLRTILRQGGRPFPLGRSMPCGRRTHNGQCGEPHNPEVGMQSRTTFAFRGGRPLNSC